jgi:glycosyltransferase involved in cell wall biosynthesis
MLTLTDCRDKKQLVKFWLKRAFIKHYRKNTDEWFVQTSNTANELIRHLGVSSDKVKLYPFYKLPQFPKADGERTDYIFVGEYSGSKGHDELLEAWRMMHEQGIDLTLHLTVSLGDMFLKKLQDATEHGVRIINHGYIPTAELAKLYVQCKATVYPSFNESFGLGLIEAMEAGCDVIASNRPFVHAICEPSKVFEPSYPPSIADAIIEYENGDKRETRLLVKNMVNEMIDKIIIKHN